MSFAYGDPNFGTDENGVFLTLPNGQKVPVTLTVALDDLGAPHGSANNPVTTTPAAGTQVQVQKIHITGITGHAAAGAFAWRVVADSIIDRIIVRPTTVAGQTCLFDAGTAATAVLSDNMLDGVDLTSSTRPYDSVLAADQGSNGKPSRFAAAGSYVTGSAQDSSSDLTSFVGDAYIYYHAA